MTMSTTDPPRPDPLAHPVTLMSPWTREEILTVLADVISQITGAPASDIGPATSFADDLHLRPIGMFTVAIAAEDRFGVKIPKQDTSTLRTTGDLADHIFDRQS
jgi:acyl carrier protein